MCSPEREGPWLLSSLSMPSFITLFTCASPRTVAECWGLEAAASCAVNWFGYVLQSAASVLGAAAKIPLLSASTSSPPWPNGQGVGPLIRRLRVRVPQGVLSLSQVSQGLKMSNPRSRELCARHMCSPERQGGGYCQLKQAIFDHTLHVCIPKNSRLVLGT